MAFPAVAPPPAQPKKYRPRPKSKQRQAQKDGIGPYGRKSVKAFYDMIHENEREVRIQQSVGTKVQHSLPEGSLTIFFRILCLF